MNIKKIESDFIICFEYLYFLLFFLKKFKMNIKRHKSLFI